VRMLAALVGTLIFAGCAPLRSEPLPQIGPPEYARVVAQRQLDVRAGETAGERAAWAIFSLNPIVIAAAVLAVEDDHGRSQLSEYDLALVRGGAATVRSRYVVQSGQCIMMRRPTGVGYVVIVAVEENRCVPE
jgi:hypothetical protein